MADWFKFYENDLDETRLQYAISKLPEVIPVWVGILSEACRHKVGTLSWGSDEIELFGFSRRLGVSIPKVNEAINILVEIRYIAKQEDSITVIKWGEKQSEYCQKRTKQQNQAGDNHHTKTNSVPTVSRQCPDSVGQEERRGEENREEKKKVAPLRRFQKPTIEAIKLQAAKIGLAETEAEKFFDFYESNGWRVGKNPMKSWSAALSNWKRNAANFTHANGLTPQAQPVQTVFGLTKIIEAKQREADGLKSRWAVETGLDTTWSSPAAREDFVALRAQIKKLNQQLAGMA